MSNSNVWYMRNKTKVWATVWCVVGLLGGNADRAITYIKTVVENPTIIEDKIKEIDNLSERMEKVEKRVDILEKVEYNIEGTTLPTPVEPEIVPKIVRGN